MEAVYNRWRAENNTLLKAATEENQSSFTQMQWTLAGFSAVIAVLVVIWQGLQHLLLKPLKTIMNHIRTIAGGDLTQNVDISGRNEMGQLAACMRCSSRWLTRSVPYAGARIRSIPARVRLPPGATTSRPVPEQQAARWKRRPPAWKS